MASERDLQVAKLCVERGWASAEQVDECLREASSAGQTMRPLEAVLRLHEYITEDTYQEITRHERRGTTIRLDPEVEAAAASPRNRFGKYILIRELGAGGMGVVFKAWQSDLRRFVALKFIRGVEAQDDLERFAREAQLAATLSHPGIAPIYESGEHDGKHFFAMQYVEGQTFDRLLSSPERPPVRKLIEILALAAEAVEYAHEHGVIHRDLKPANVMVDPRGRAYVMDFGLAKSVRTGSSLTGSGFTVGTPSYMAPEQAQADAARIGPRSDVYALGAILYQIGAGRAPFEGENVLQVLVDVVNRDPVTPRKLNPKFHPELETVALKALEKDPERRFPSAAEFAADLRRWLDGEPVHARAAGTLSRLVRRIRKHKAIAAGATAVLLGIAIAAGSLGLRQREKSARAAALPYYQEAADAFEESDRLRRMPSADLSQYRALVMKAEAFSREAIARDPTYAEAQFVLALAASRKGVLEEESIAHFSRVLELEPEHLRAALERGRVRLKMLHERYGLDTISQRTGKAGPRFTFKPKDAGFETLRAATLADLERAARLSPRESEKALLQGAAALASWRPGQDADLDRAEASLRRARELAPNDAYTCFLLGRARFMRADLEGASDRMEEAVALIPADFDTLYSAALTLSYSGRTAKGLEFVERALEIWPENYLLWSKRGDLLSQLGREPQALISYEQSIRLEPHQIQPYVGLGYLHYSKERFQEAWEVYTRALKALPDEPTLLEALGASLVGLARLEEAEAVMDRVTALRGDAESFSNRGAVRSQRGQAARAMEDFERALALAPDDANVHYSLATHLLRTEKTGDAVLHFERALKEGRDHPDTHYWLSEALFKLARYEESLTHALQALKRGRDDSLAHFGAADNFLRLKRPAEAEEAYTRGLERQADAPLALARRGQARCEQGRLDEGLEDYLAALRLKPADADALREAALIHFMKKRYGPALDFADRSISAGRDDLDIHSLRGETLRNLERPAEAEKAFDRALERKRDDPILHFYRSRVRYEQGRKEEAFADLEAAIRIKPDFAQAIGQRGMLKVKEKRPREALPDLRRALDLLPALKPVLQPYLEQAQREGKPGDF